MVTPAPMPASRASAATRRQSSSVSAIETPWLRRLKVSVETTTKLISSMPAARARSKPRSFITRPIWRTPLPRGSRATRSSASAICGTRFGLTKLVTSSRRTPAATARAISSSLVSVDTSARSFWMPSRADTSMISTASAMSAPVSAPASCLDKALLPTRPIGNLRTSAAGHGAARVTLYQPCLFTIAARRGKISVRRGTRFRVGTGSLSYACRRRAPTGRQVRAP